MKKQVSLLLSAGLFAVAMLAFTQCDSPQAASNNTTSDNANGGSVVANKIAYVYIDSISSNYEFWLEQVEKWQAHANKLENEFQNRVRGLQTEAQNLQAAAENRTMTQNQFIAAQENYLKKEQNLQQYQVNLQQEVAGMQNKMMNEVYDKISSFLEGYGQENDLDLILTYQKGNGVWYAREGMDITEAVIEGLNEAYEMEKNGGAAPAAATDTTSAQ